MHMGTRGSHTSSKAIRNEIGDVTKGTGVGHSQSQRHSSQRGLHNLPAPGAAAGARAVPTYPRAVPTYPCRLLKPQPHPSTRICRLPYTRAFRAMRGKAWPAEQAGQTRGTAGVPCTHPDRGGPVTVRASRRGLEEGTARNGQRHC